MLPASLILINYRSADLVVDALRHLESQREDRPCEIIVIDNSPSEGLEARLGTRILYRATARNIGFAAGVNLGLEAASQEIVILLNPDARPEPGCCAGLVRILGETSRAGVAGPALLSADGEAAGSPPSATRTDAGLLTVLAENTMLRRFLPPRWLDQRYFLRAGPSAGPAMEPVPAAMVQGACFALRLEVVRRIGAFDERYFLYWEENDFCRRARRAGFTVLFCPELNCVHFGGGSTHDTEAARRHYWYGLFAFWRKHEGWARTTFLRAALIVGIAAEVVLLGALRLTRRADKTLGADLLENRRRLREVTRRARPEPMP